MKSEVYEKSIKKWKKENPNWKSLIKKVEKTVKKMALTTKEHTYQELRISNTLIGSEDKEVLEAVRIKLEEICFVMGYDPEKNLRILVPSWAAMLRWQLRKERMRLKNLA